MSNVTGAAVARNGTRSWRFSVGIVLLLSGALLAAVTTLAPSAPSATAQTDQTTCYSINDGVGTMISHVAGVETTIGPTGLTSIESLAANQDRNELWAYDFNTDAFHVFVPGSSTPSSTLGFGGTGDLDGLTWVNHTDGNPSNDELWGTYRNGVNTNPDGSVGTNVADQIVQINPTTGAVISGPTDIFDPGAGGANELDDNDGLIWDPTSGTIYGVIGGDTTANRLITINPLTGAITELILSLGGGDIFDIESLGAGTDGQIYATTGEDPTTPNNFYSINKNTGVVTFISALAAGADFEATACLTAAPPLTVTPSVCYTVDEGNGANDNHLVRVDIAADTSVVFTDLGVIDNGTVNTLNIEALAYRNGFEPRPLYTYDPATNDLLRISTTSGGDTVVVANIALGDIDGLTFRFDNDTDPNNDELWGVIRNAGTPLDQLVQINPSTGAVVSGPIDIATGGTGVQNDVDGLAWDPETDRFFSPVNGSTNINDIIVIDRVTGAVTTIGSTGVEDIEGNGFTDDGQLYGMTGDDGATPNEFLLIDKVTGAATSLGAIPIYGDYESLDCAGEVPPMVGSLGDKVWEDTNQNGIDDDGANGIQGVTVNLLDGAGAPTGQTTTTDASGNYTFTGLLAGDYIVEVVLPGGRTFTTQDEPTATDATDSDVDTTTGRTGVISLGAGANDLTNDAGILPLLGSLGDKVFEDTNQNGIDDDGANGIQGVTVNLLDGAGAPTGQTTTTDASGNYSFTDLLAGDYIVEVVLPGGRAFTTQDEPTATDATDSDVDTTTGRTGVITLGAGEDDPTNDAGILPLGSLGDKVFEDTNQNGIDDDGANGIQGVTVNLLDGTGAPTGQTTTTDASGNYSFTGLLAGDYIVEVVLPGGRTFTAQDDPAATDATDSDVDTTTGRTGVITLGDGEDDPTNDAGILPLLGSLGDKVFEDTNQNGIDDDGVNGIQGVTVNLLDGTGAPTGQTTTTDASGNYSFTDLLAGDYIVEVVLPGGRAFTTQDEPTATDATDSDVDTTTGRTGVISLGAGESDPTNDAGILPLLGSLGDKVFEDTNQNGIDDDGVNGIQGVTVNLLDGTGAPTGLTTTTDASGIYTFTGLLAGDYIVEVVAPAGRGFTTQDEPTATDATDSDVDTTTGRTGVITLGAGEDDPTNDAGILPLGSLGDKVFEDTNQNGIDDDGANGIQGVTVNLLDGTGAPTGQTTTTDASGNYSFTGLLAGDYIVEVVLPGGRTFTAQDDPAATDATDSDVDTTTGRTGVINLAPGETDNSNDAGILPLLGSLGDKVFEDTNQNGIDDDGANGIQGVTVNLLDGAGAPTGLTTTTDASGIYTFTGLLAGDYIVEVVAPAGRTFTTQDEPTATDATDSDVDTTTGRTGVISLGAGETDNSNDAGILPLLGSLGDKVFEDTNQNGIDDDGANGIQGVTVNLLDGTGAPTGLTTTTNASGIYTFTGLLAGDYIVEVVAPAGRVFTTQDEPTATDATDSDVDTTTGRTGVISLGAGANDLTNDAGILPLLGSLGDKVFEDTNQNGIDDDGANGIQGVTVNLLDGAGAPTGLTTTTDTNGNYTFTGLLAGDYIVEVVAPAGRVFTTQDEPTATDATDSDVDTTTGRTGVITLGAGEDDPTNDAGILPLVGALGDKVFEDTNQNGIDDDGANGIQGVTVNLLDGAGAPTGLTTTTDTNGNYTFTGLLAGDYIVEVVAPAGRVFTTQDEPTATDATDSDVDTTTGRTGVITLAPGELDLTNDAGILPLLGSLGDKVFEDTNQNGIDDDGANGIQGVTVNLLDGTGAPTGLTTTTNASGIYTFTGLLAGDYIVEVVAPAGRVFTTQDEPTATDATDSDVDTTTGRTGVITLGAGEDDPTNDAGILPLVGALGDKVFEDTNQNGIDDDGANGIQGVTVNLLDGTGAPTGLTTTTDATGSYLFPGLLAGDYIVEVVLPGGRTFTTQDEPTATDATDSDVDTTTGRTGVITLDAGENDLTNDAGILPLLGSLGDKVFEDTNQNGIDDDGANGIQGVTVNLLDGAGAPTGLTTTTDATGIYTFTGLLAGDYIVEVVAPAGRTFTTQDEPTATDATDSDVDTTTGRTGVITLGAGEDDPTNDAGILPLLGSLGDKVWEDTNQNGIDDDGANGIQGVTVNLLDGAGAPTGQTTTTDATGIYTFTGLLAGDYIVEVVAPAGRVFTTQDEPTATDATDSDVDTTTGRTGVITLGAGANDLTNDAGILPLLGSLGDKVWEDTNQNGIDDDGANGIQGVTVNLLDGAGAPTGQTTTTDATGSYLFPALLAGDYIVEVVLPAGRGFTTQDEPTATDATDSDVDTTTGRTGVISLGAGENDPTNDAGILPLGTLGDKVFEDTNQNGIDDDGANGIQGVTVNLLDGTGAPTGLTTTTDASGIYTFPGLNAGDYIVEVVLPGGRTFTTQNNGDDATDSDVDTTTGRTGVINLAPGETDNSNDAGILPLLGSLGDKVFEDTNQNGIDDDGANGIQGVTVNLLDGTGAPTGLTTTTDATGIYTFTGLLAGDYIVEVVAPAGRVFTTQDEPTATDATDSDVDTTTGRTGVITLGAGEDDPTNDAGILPLLGSLGDKVWEDTNQNGIDDDGANGIQGVTVNLLDGTGAPTGLTTTTDATGIYTFTGLLAGDYIVEVVLPGGRAFATQDIGDDATDSDVDTTTGRTGVITLGAGENDPTNDAGILPLGTLGDKVFEDTNQNGIDDDGANGIQGVTVNLLDGTGAPTGQTTTTDANGIYTFTGLLAGDYIVEVVLPGGRTFTIQDEPTATDATDSDVDTTTGRTGIINLAPGETDNSNDAGILPLVGALGDKVWEDTNQNGIDDDGANGIQGVTVNLLDGTGAPTGQTTTTDATGNYLFTGLLPGDYIVEVVLPGGRVFTTQDEPTATDATDSDVDTTTGRTGVISLGAGASDLTNDAGILPLPQIATIGNFVWDDENENGAQDSEPGIPNVQVTVYAVDGAGNLLPNPVIVTTDASGLWQLDVAPGRYRVAVTLPPNGSFTTQDGAGVPDDQDSDVATSGPDFGFTGIYDVADGETNLTIDAGVTFPPLPATLGDFVWLDENGNGVQDPLEPGIAGIRVDVLDGAQNVVGFDTTDTNGAWSVSVPPGTYTVRVINTTAGAFTTPLAGGNTAADSDVDATGVTASITLAEGENNPTIDAGILPVENPVIGLAKDLTAGPTLLGNGNWSLTYTFAIENMGDVALSDVVLVDDFAATFAPDGTVVSGPTPNGGTCSAEVATGTGALAVGASCVAVWDVEVSGLVPGTTYNNTATVTGTSPLGEDVSDISDDGTDVDTDNDGNPNEPGENDPTPAMIPAEGPVIGLAKDLTAGPTLLGNGNWSLTYTFAIENMGDVALSDVVLADDFAATFAPDGTVVSGPTPNGGTCSAEVATGTGALAVGASCVAVWDVEVSGLVPGTTYNNTATVTGTSPLGEDVSDISDDGTDVDTDNDGNPNEPGENDPTPAVVPENPVIGLAKELVGTPTLNGAGNHDITYSFVITNLGDVALSDIALADDFAATFAPDGTVVSGPTPNGGTCSAAVATGTGSLAVGASCVAVWDVEVSGLVPGTTYNNTATVTGTSPLGEDVSDISDDGTDVDADNDGDPDEPGENDPTPTLIPALGLAILGDRVWSDLNANGIQDPAEPGIPGVTVQIYTAGGTLLEQTVTGANGIYTSSPLAAGSFVVAFVVPANYFLSPQGAGTDPALDSNAGADGLTAAVAVGAGETNLTIDAGLVPAAQLGNVIFSDTNSNGVQDPGEGPVAGVVVTLFKANPDGTKGAQVASQVTGADGVYLFDGLEPGDYIVVVRPPAGFGLTTQNAGGNDETDSDFSPATGESGVISLLPGANNQTVDGGLVPLTGCNLPSRFNTTFNAYIDPCLPGIVLEYPGSFDNPPVTQTTMFTAPDAQVATVDGEETPLALTGGNANLLTTLSIAMMGFGGLLLIGARRERDQELDA